MLNARAAQALVCLIALAGVGPAAGAGQRGFGGARAPDGSAVGKQWLFLVGIDEYGDDSGWQKLHCAVSDAKAVRDALQSRYHIDQVFELYNQEATWGRIDERLRWLAKHTQPDDGVLVYYAGHGHLDALTKLGAWVPADGDRTPRSWMASTYVKRLLGSMTAKHVLLISDSCFAGDFFKTRGDQVETIDEPYYRRKYRLQSRQAVTSGGMEPVMDISLDGHSPFAHYLLRALARNQKPYLVPRELFDGLKLGVARNSGQTPEVGFLKDAQDEGGEFIFFLRRGRGPGPVIAPRVGALEVSCNVEAAAVFVDDQAIGAVQGGVLRKADVAVGKRMVAVRMEGYREWASEVEVQQGQTASLDAKLDKASDAAKLTIRSEPSGAEIFFSDMDKSYGRTPATFTAKPGTYHVILRFADGRTWRGKVSVDGPGDDKEVVGVLPKQEAAGPSGKTWTNPKDGSEMVLVPAGTFKMGGKESYEGGMIHDVHVAAFYIGKYEVTNKQFKKFVDANPQWRKGRVDSKYATSCYLKHWENDTYPSDKADHPVVYVSWFAAKAYCEWAGGRLLTEAEWEYACRAGSNAKYCFGDSDSQLGDYAWYYKNSGKSTHPVGQKKPNQWGIHDMHGNVWEWCSSMYRHYPYKADDGREDLDVPGSRRVVRGGGWGYDAGDCRSAARDGFTPTSCDDGLGFRVVVSSARAPR